MEGLMWAISPGLNGTPMPFQHQGYRVCMKEHKGSWSLQNTDYFQLITGYFSPLLPEILSLEIGAFWQFQILFWQFNLAIMKSD
jgi:hypothetical protein